MINESQLEQKCISLFQDIGYDYICGYDIAPDSDTPERKIYEEVLLFDRLFQAVRRINPNVPEQVLDDEIHTLGKNQHPILSYSNRAFHKVLLKGLDVEYIEGNEKKHDLISLIDFENIKNNEFLVVNQFSISGATHTRRPDLIVFINGLPIAVIELKNPAETNTDIWDAYNQLHNYKEEIQDLFIFNEAMVISDGMTARLGSLTANQDRYLPWKTVKNQDDKPILEFQIETLIKGFFDKTLLLDYLRFFIIFEQDGDVINKKIAGYHQFHAVREAVRLTLIASSDNRNTVRDLIINAKEEERISSRKGGVVWHTQGSGKSLSMTCYASKLLQQPEMNNPTIVVVTDRNDLDGQLFETFSNAEELLRQTPVQADSRDILREALTSRQSGGIFFTTIQKFALLAEEKDHPILSDRSNIIVISDEAHRSQYGMDAKLNKKTGKYHYGYAKHLRDALPKATFIGFTGTPISFADKDTQATFGEYVSVYDIQDAVDDNATVQIYYESRLAKLDIHTKEIEALNKEVDEVIEDEEDIEAREDTKSKWTALEKLVGADPRLKEVAQDIVNHFEDRTKTIDGKAMIVCMSRSICAQLYKLITSIKPDWHSVDPEKGDIKVIMTGSSADKEELQPHVYTKTVKKRLEKRFKNPTDEFKLVIVRDMWLTGFDAPSCHTMYIDKPMRGHNLMQAIARVNRVFGDKQGGLVVDYIGIAGELKEALKIYTNAKGKGLPTMKAEEAFTILVNKLDACRGLFHDFDYSKYKSDPLSLLVPASNYVLENEDGKKRFLDLMAAINKALSLCSTLDAAKPIKEEIAFFNAIKAVLTKYTIVDKKRLEEEKHSILKQILDNAVVADGVEDIFKLAGLEKPNIGLLSDAFLKDLAHIKEKNLAVELLAKLLRDGIKSREFKNVIQERKYSDRLMDTLNRYHNRMITTAQVIEELIKMAKEYQEELMKNKDMGLNPDEIAFYDALANNESAVRELGNEILKKIAIELTESLRKSVSVDWHKRDNIQAKIRNIIRRLLKKYKYPPDKQQKAIDDVLEQAKELADVWGNEY